MALSGTNQVQARPHNRRAVLETIRQHGPISRTEVARRVGLSTQTISKIAAELVEQGFLTPISGKPKGRGFPAPSFEIAPEGGFAVGVVISPRGLEAGLMDLAGTLIARRKIAAPRMSAAEAFGRIADVVADLARCCPRDKILGVGISLPGPFGIEAMSFVGSTTMEGWTESDIRDGLCAAVPFPAIVDRVTSAAAHGEWLYGRGKEFRDFYYLFMAVGLGGAMIHDGQVMRGAHGNASEIGHIPIVLNGEPCPCGNRGCLERYFSMEAHDRHLAEIGESAWLEVVRPILRAAIVTIENLYEPDTIVLGGQVPDRLWAQILDMTQDLPVSLGARSDRIVPRVVLSGAGADAAIRGAASLAVSRVFSPNDDHPAPVAGRLEKETQ